MESKNEKDQQKNNNDNEQTKITTTQPQSSILLTQSNLDWSSQSSGFSLTSPINSTNETPSAPEQQQQPESQNQSETLPQSQNKNIPPSDLNIGESKSNPSTIPTYKEVDYHWFYQKEIPSDQEANQPDLWQAFSLLDSYQLEAALHQGRLDEMIPTNGTRFDVNLRKRIRVPVYWQGSEGKVQRCSWFYQRENDHCFIPYSENVSELLESTYRDCSLSQQWNRRLNLSNNSYVIFYAGNSVYQYFNEDSTQSGTGWSALLSTSDSPTGTQSTGCSRSRYCYRGPWSIQTVPERDESNMSVQNLIFIVHGIGEFCDLSFRSLKYVVDDFRSMTYDLIQTHYGPSAGRTEFLPISWHRALHTKSVDERLQEITLPSIHRLRSFTNDTILDALFYTSPTHSSLVMNFVAKEINRLYGIFLQRNPYFGGKIALAGHSLGSLILFDLLSQQKSSPTESPQKNLSIQSSESTVEQIHFRPFCLFALGSPLAAFLTVRGIELNEDYRLPTCPGFYNIFHPYDPIAYRLEPLINREFSKLKPVLIPHHKGRKRLHLIVKDSLQRVGTDLKQKLMSSINSWIGGIYGFARAHYDDDVNGEKIQEQQQGSEVAATNSEITKSELSNQTNESESNDETSTNTETNPTTDLIEEDLNRILKLSFGNLNSGRRLDYVLQEKPFEIVNEYVFAITSHTCYWFSEDTSLLMLYELYGKPKNETIPVQEAAATTTSSSDQIQTKVNKSEDV